MKKTLELMEIHYVGEPNIVYERYMFFQRSQGKDESFQSYLTAVQELAGTCDFKDLRDDMIRESRQNCLWNGEHHDAAPITTEEEPHTRGVHRTLPESGNKCDVH